MITVPKSLLFAAMRNPVLNRAVTCKINEFSLYN